MTQKVKVYIFLHSHCHEANTDSICTNTGGLHVVPQNLAVVEDNEHPNGS